MPRREQDLAGDEFEQTLSRDPHETEETGPSRCWVIGATQHFEAHHSGQSVRNARQAAQAVRSDEGRCREGCEKTSGTGRRDEGKPLWKTSMMKFRVSEEKCERIEDEVVTGDMDKRMREHLLSLAAVHCIRMVDELRREHVGKQWEIEQCDEQCEGGDFLVS